MKRLLAFVAFLAVVSACSGSGGRTVPADQALMHGSNPGKLSAVLRPPASRSFAIPSLPAELQHLKMPSLTRENAAAMLARRSTLSSARSTQGRSTGFFANETYVGQDAGGFAAYWMPYFGYYTYGSPTQGTIPYPGFLFKYNFAWLYDLGGNSSSSSDAYFYDFGSSAGKIGVFYTAPSYGSDANFLYLYDFGVGGHFLGYEQNTIGPRWFYDYTAATWMTGNMAIKETAGGAAAFVRPDSHRTLYYLDVDTAASQMCTGSCVSSWPLFTPTDGSVNTGDMAIITRSDGAGQWAYQGHPLYTFAGDGGADQANGDTLPDFNGHWHVARPAGTVVPTPTPDPLPTPDRCPGGYC